MAANSDEVAAKIMTKPNHMGTMSERGVDQFVFLPSDRGEGDTLDLLAEEVVPHLG